MVRVFGTIIDAEKNLLSNKIVSFEWVNKKNMPVIGFTSEGILVQKGEETTDANGYFEIFLIPNNPAPNETYYKIGVEVISNDGYKTVISRNIYLDGTVTEVDISQLLIGEPIQVPDTPIVDTLYVLNAKSDGTRVWEVLPVGNGTGDVLWSQIDSDSDGVVDNAKKVNGYTVEMDVTSEEISFLEVSTAWDNA